MSLTVVTRFYPAYVNSRHKGTETTRAGSHEHLALVSQALFEETNLVFYFKCWDPEDMHVECVVRRS